MIDLSTVRSFSRIRIHKAILFIQINNACYKKDHWLTGQLYLAIIANNDTFCSLCDRVLVTTELVTSEIHCTKGFFFRIKVCFSSHFSAKNRWQTGSVR